jgi:hypothetical protein
MKKKNHIEFDPDRHKYKNTNTNEYYSGVTTWISSIKHPFDGSTVATQKRLGITHEEVLALWAKKNKLSTDRGTWIHNRCEDYLLADGYQARLKIKLENKKNEWYKDIPFKYLDKLIKKKCKLHIEDILYHDGWKISGQSDLVLEYKNHIEIEDWKTNEKEELNKVMWYTKKFKTAFTELDETSYNEYAIQLVVYGIMAEIYYGKPCKKFTINHLYNGFRQYVIEKELVEYIRSVIKTLFI